MTELEQYWHDRIANESHYPIPEYMQGGLVRWVVHGLQPGGFLSACLCNDFLGAAGHADDTNRELLFNYAYVLHNCVPADCKGSVERFNNWKGLANMQEAITIGVGDEETN